MYHIYRLSTFFNICSKLKYTQSSKNKANKKVKMENFTKKLAITISLSLVTNMSYAENFKRFSVSAGWTHMISMGKVQPMRISTAVAENMRSKVGMISGETAFNNMDQSRINDMDPNLVGLLSPVINEDDPNDKQYILDQLIASGEDSDSPEEFLELTTGTAEINGLSSWTSNAGLEVEDVDTLGLMFTYNVNEHVSLQFNAGIPPKIDLKGKGKIYAPLTATAEPLDGGFGTLYIKNNLLITDLDSFDKAASARAWTPGFQAQYYFGKPGVNKFRPFIGGGFMYAHFTDIKINDGVKADLIAAGHMIQNIYDDKAGAALEGKVSSGQINVEVDADDAFAPMVTAGFTYDFKEDWFATASVSYAKMDNTATITVVNQNNNLIKAKTTIDIDPLITYVGVGYRF